MNTDIVRDLAKYQEGWKGGLPETPCGYGSKVAVTKEQREFLARLFDDYGIGSIADIGAGDLNWIRHMDLTGIDYMPFDLVPRYKSVVEFDILQDIPPPVDLILCLWVLNHFNFDMCRLAIANLKESGAEYIAMTDRPQWHAEQPPEIQAKPLEELTLNKKGDRIVFFRLADW
jgi:hypothetical protein